ncbi:MAG: RNA methyltransferase [Burkholderiales bacterium]|nr:RNA methyltransferase [Burkholderiales bacterium]
MYSRIDSKDNNLVKQIVHLASNRHYREELHLGIIYGQHLLEEAIKSGVIHKVLIDDKCYPKYQDLLHTLPENIVYLTTPTIIDKINLLESKTDIVGVVQFAKLPFNSQLYAMDCVVLEKIQNPLNLGSIMRVAKAAGVNNIIISPGSVDIYNPKVLHVAQGAIFDLNLYVDVDIIEFISEYKGMVLATMPKVTTSLYTINLTTKPVAWVFGNEGSGLSRTVLDRIKQQITIPMQNNTESLNVAMAVSVCLFEQLRQRLM